MILPSPRSIKGRTDHAIEASISDARFQVSTLRLRSEEMEGWYLPAL
jgi:hypothetical protein